MSGTPRWRSSVGAITRAITAVGAGLGYVYVTHDVHRYRGGAEPATRGLWTAAVSATFLPPVPRACHSGGLHATALR